MSFPNPLYDPSRRRKAGPRRYNRSPASRHSPLASIATTAAVAYGAYRLGAWAWSAYFGDGDGDVGDKEQDEDAGILYEWTENYRAVERDIRREEGFPTLSEEEETTDGENENAPDASGGDGEASKPGDRRRQFWTKDGHSGDGIARKDTEEAAATTSTGLGAAISAGIAAGIHSYNQCSQPQPSIEDQERQLRTARCRLETSRAMFDFLPTLKKAIAKETDVRVETAELKKMRIRKKEISEMKINMESGDDKNNQINLEEINGEERSIWDKEQRLWNYVKNKSVTRLVATIYAHTVIFLVLTVQVNLLGGRLLREEQDKKEPMGQNQQPSNATLGGERYRVSHQAVLANTYHYLFTEGIPALVASVEGAISEILQNWDVLGDSASLRDVSGWLEHARDEIERRQEKIGGSNPLLKYVIPPEGEAAAARDSSEKDELAKYILDETYDLLESPAYANAQRQCLNATFDQLRTKVLVNLFLPEDEIPLAKAITHFQKAAVKSFHTHPSHNEEIENWGGILGMMERPLPSVPNAYISKLERLEYVLELADVCF